MLAVAGGGGTFPWSPTKAGNLATSGSAYAIDTGSGYKAFPSLCTIPGGLLLVYRHGTQHISSDGHIVARKSTDGGATWGSPYTVYDPADDARDPNVTRLSDGRIALTTFRYDGSNAYQVEVLFSSDDGATFGTPVVVDTYYDGNGITYAYAAVSAPLVEVSASLYLVPLYMRNSGGSTNWNAFVVSSTDGGTSFGNADLIATGGSKSWTEPWIVPIAASLLCLIRVDNLNDTYQTTSTDDGATWAAASYVWHGDARNATIRTNSGALFTTGRNGGSQGQYQTSWNDGSTWATRTNLPSPSTSYQYGAVVHRTPHEVLLIWSQQTSTTDADLYAQVFQDSGTG